MFLRTLLSRILALLLPLALSATLYLYLYPVFNGCAFPLPRSKPSIAGDGSFLRDLQQNPSANTLLQHLRTPDSAAHPQPAIFRLLVLADPQLEGDTSLPLPEWKLAARVKKHWKAVQDAVEVTSTNAPFPKYLLSPEVLTNFTAGLWTIISEDIPRSLRAAQKRLDLLGNDYYLAHIYRTLFWWTRPTHTTVLGDLVGSQWIDDDEFTWRSQRYWTRVFKGGQRLDDDITRTGAPNGDNIQIQELEPLGPNSDPAWPRRIINIAGNHDIGYAGDASEARMERFEREFGRANWDIRFQHPPIVSGANDTERPDMAGQSAITPTLHLINLNTLIFDTPALSEAAQTHSYDYLNDLISKRLYPVEDQSTFTLLLTHLPLHKKEGVCTDGPYFTFHEDDDNDGPDGIPRWKEGGLREQNHLSDFISASGILEGIFGMSGSENAVAGGHGRKGLILTGHDHTGCDTIHFVNHTANGTEDEKLDEGDSGDISSQSWKWAAKRYTESDVQPETPSIREVTLRSMMGEFGGNAGLLSVWFDVDMGEWDYEIVMCPAGVQHLWWAVHVIILVTLIAAVLWVMAQLLGSAEASTQDVAQNNTRSKKDQSSTVPLEKASERKKQ